MPASPPSLEFSGPWCAGSVADYRGAVSAPVTDARTAHAVGVERLLESYRAVPPAASVRLAKRTSNLFRTRAKTDAKGLDTSGLTDVIAVDPDERTADVAGMCTYEDLVAATLPFGLAPLVVPQLKTITLGGAVTGLGIESTSFRNGLPHESVLEMDILTGAGEVVTASPHRARRPVPRVPQLVRNARLRGAPAHRARARRAVRRAHASALPRPRRPDGGDGQHRRDRSSRRRAGRLPRRRGVQRGRELSVPRREDGGTRPRQRLHRPADLLPLDPARRRAPRTIGSPSTTTSGGGTPTGSGVPRRSARSIRSSAGSGRGGTAAAASTRS